MEQDQSYVDSRHEQLAIYAAWALLIVALFLNMGAYPLFLEEPRRALIALEMLLNDNLLVPTEFGEYYYRKPPIWNWMIILGYKLFGFNEFAVRVFGVLSYLTQGALIVWAGSKYVSRPFGHLSALLFLTVVNGLFYMTGVPGEIDLFYSLVTFLMFVAIFHFLEKENYLLLFVVTYGLTAVGVLTKGIPSFAFTALTLLAVAVDKKKFKLLFSWQHFVGIGLLAIILSVYFYAYNQYHDVASYFFAEDNSLFAQSADKSFLGSELAEIAVHFATFPFGILANLMPAMLLLVFFIGRKDVFKKVWAQPLLRYFILVFLVNVIIYWISPGSRSRYLYMLYPVPVMLVTFAYLQQGSKKWMHGFMRVAVISLLVILGIGCAVIAVFGEEMKMSVPNLKITTILLFLTVVFLLFILWKRKITPVVVMILALVVLRLGYATTVQLQRATTADMAQAKDDADIISRLIREDPIYLYKQVPISRQHIFYVERNTMSVVRYYKEGTDARYLWVAADEADELTGYNLIYQYQFRRGKAYIMERTVQ